MSRDSMLERIRQATERGRAYRVSAGNSATTAGYVGAGEDLCRAMADQVIGVGGNAYIVEGWTQARETLGGIIQQHEARSALCWQHANLEKLSISEILGSQRVEYHNFNSLVELDESRQRITMLSADIGISGVDYAIAETGTLLVCSRPGQERCATLLPPVHVAIVMRQQIVPDLIGAIDAFQADRMSLPSNIALITGPSKTGDIELQLTTGVHGPGQCNVIVVRNDE